MKTPETPEKSMIDPTSPHWWNCPACKDTNSQRFMFCGHCGYTGFYQGPHVCLGPGCGYKLASTEISGE